jgi:hypothetical protein
VVVSVVLASVVMVVVWGMGKVGVRDHGNEANKVMRLGGCRLGLCSTRSQQSDCTCAHPTIAVQVVVHTRSQSQPPPRRSRQALGRCS